VEKESPYLSKMHHSKTLLNVGARALGL